MDQTIRQRSKWPPTYPDSITGVRLLIGREHGETDK